MKIVSEMNYNVCSSGMLSLYSTATVSANKAVCCWMIVGKLLEVHGEGSSTTTHGKTSELGERVDRPDNYEPPVLSSV